MPFELDILCLANSWKHGGRCIAGKVYGGDRSGEWIRPVSAIAGQRQITYAQMAYGAGRYADVLDIIRIRFEGAEPNTFQRENLIVSNSQWLKLGTLDNDDLEDWIDTPRTVWTNGMSSRYGHNDKMDSLRLFATRSSLMMIQPVNPRVKVAAEYDGKIKVRILFEYGGHHHALTTTDLWAQDTYRGLGVGEYQLPPVIAMTISLGERMSTGDSAKIVAQIFKE